MKHAYRFFAPGPDSAGSVGPGSDEFDESEIWGSPPVEPRPAEPRRPAGSARPGRKKPPADRVAAPSSVPVSIPDWSKILREECGGKGVNTRKWEACGDDDWEEGGEGTAGVMIPPHEFLGRNRAAPFSVHEGVGRTLKGRDLSRLRNAIWEKTGFQD